MISKNMVETTMLISISLPFTVIDALVGVWARTIVDMFVGAKVVVIEARTNVVVDSLICVVTDELADVFIGMCADILVEVSFSGVGIIVVAAAVVALEFNTVPVSCVVNVLPGIMVGVLVNILTGTLASVIICVVSSIGVDALTEVNINVWISVPAPLENTLLIG